MGGLMGSWASSGASVVGHGCIQGEERWPCLQGSSASFGALVVGHGCTKDCGGVPQPLGLLEATQAGEALGGGAA